MTRVTDFGIDRAATIHAALLFGVECGSTASTAAGRRIQDSFGDELHASRLVAIHR